MTGGYFMVDLGGLDLTDTTKQDISGLYKRVQEGIKSGKPLIGYNAVWGDNSDAPMTPIAFFAQQWSSDMVVGTASILNITCNEDDEVYVSSLIGG